MEILFRDFIEPRVEENPLRLLALKAIKNIFVIRPMLNKLLSRSISHAIEGPLSYHSTFFAKLTALFPYGATRPNIHLMKECVSKAIKADTFALKRNARNICHCIYQVYYYGDIVDKPAMQDFMVQMGVATDVGETKPQLHWLSYAGVIRFGEEVEREFINQLFGDRIKNKIFLRLTGDEEFHGFPDSTVRVFEDYEKQGSILAAALYENLLNPEAWNILATTVFNNSLQNNQYDPHLLEQASYFYLLTQLFSRQKYQPTQKYCYNYIRCQSLSYLIGDIFPPPSFLRDVISYLFLPESYFFTYKEQCVEPFIELLKIHLPQCHASIKEKIQKVINQEQWFGETCLKKGFDLGEIR